MTIDEIRELIQLAKESGVAELEVQRGENRVRVRLSFGSETSVILPAPATASAPAPAAPAPKVEPASASKEPDTLIYTKSPIVGTFYESSSPGAAAFVKIGDEIESGQVLCIVEAMKLMNEIESDASGEIVRCLVSNGQAIEFGQPLFAIRLA